MTRPSQKHPARRDPGAPVGRYSPAPEPAAGTASGTPVTARRPRTVSDLMTRDLVTIAPDASIRDLIRVLREHGIGGMPVVDRDGTVLGTVSSSDVLWLATGEAEGTTGFVTADTLDTHCVREIMTPDVFGVGPDTSLPELRRFFARTGVHRAPVLEDGVIIGIVGLSDVLDTLLA
ncbi:MAG TPA: CBS domain-containing protein [Longimicrobiales bacterium]